MLNNFIYAQTKDLFIEQLEAGNILDEAIVFIEDTKEIWNHGHYFAGEYLDAAIISNLQLDVDTLKEQINNILDSDSITVDDQLPFLNERTFVLYDFRKINSSANAYSLSSSTYYTNYQTSYNNYVSVLNTIISATSDQLPLSIAELELSSQMTSFYNTRALLLIQIDNAIKASVDEIAQNTGYLISTFTKGQTNIEGGIVLTETMFIGGNGGNTQSFLNGGEYATDTEHGKLIFAAGIPDGTTDLEERAKEAGTRVYEDGQIISNNTILESGCKIGELDVTAEGLIVNECGYLGASVIPGQLSANRSSADGSSCTMMRSNLLSSDGLSLYINSYDKEDNLYDFVHQAITISGDAVDEGIDISAPNVSTAMRAKSGVFEGLRPNVRLITAAGTSSSPHVLDEYDHTIIVDFSTSNSTVYLKLPTAPKNGQRYEIITTDADIDLSINTSSKTVVACNEGSTNTSGTISFTAAYRRHVTFIYEATSGKWFLFYRNLSS